MKLTKTRYPGVYKYESEADVVFYISYRLRCEGGTFKQVQEVAGRQKRDNMTAAKASQVRARRIGGELSNQERRAVRKKQQWTVSALWEEYQRANPGRKEKGMEYLFGKYLEPYFGHLLPADILALGIDRLKRRELKDKSPKTVAHTLQLLIRIINFGTKRGLCQGPGFTVQLPRVSNQKTEDLTPEQLTRLLEVIDGHIKYQTPYRQGAAMMKLALYTGMRRGEMFKLMWADIDWHRNNIVLRDAKSGRDEVIPLSSYAGALLSTIKETEETGSPYVFPGVGGGQRHSITKLVNKLKAESELPADFRPLHGIRHVFASMLVSNDVSLDIVSRLLTHKGQTVTHRYAHIRDDALRQAAELAGRLVKAAARQHAIPLQGNG